MKNIVIIDSGMGGVAVLSRLMKSVVANYYYYADTAHMPFGNRDKATLCYYAESIILQLQQNIDIDIVVFACNTLTVACIKYMRHIFADIVFFGCEPPLSQVLQYTTSSGVLVATPFVINNTPMLPSLQKVAMPNLASMVEDNINHRQIASYIEPLLAPCDRFDSIVLGCTHYSHIRNVFAQLYPSVKIFDSVDPLVARIKKNNKKSRDFAYESTVKWYFSSDSCVNQEKYQKLLQQNCKFY